MGGVGATLPPDIRCDHASAASEAKHVQSMSGSFCPVLCSTSCWDASMRLPGTQSLDMPTCDTHDMTKDITFVKPAACTDAFVPQITVLNMCARLQSAICGSLEHRVQDARSGVNVDPDHAATPILTDEDISAIRSARSSPRSSSLPC